MFLSLVWHDDDAFRFLVRSHQLMARGDGRQEVDIRHASDLDRYASQG
jgi:hypothetical protein